MSFYEIDPVSTNIEVFNVITSSISMIILSLFVVIIDPISMTSAFAYNTL